MIYDERTNVTRYEGISELHDALTLLSEMDFSAMRDGLYSLSDKLFYRIITYRTKERAQARPESHRAYIDIQYILEGSEKIAFASVSDAFELEESRPQEDLLFYKPDEMNEVCLGKGFFMILFPSDIHAPGIADGPTANVRKVVIKCAAEHTQTLD